MKEGGRCGEGEGEGDEEGKGEEGELAKCNLLQGTGTFFTPIKHEHCIFITLSGLGVCLPSSWAFYTSSF